MELGDFDHLFRLKLDCWTPLRAAYHGFFNDEEVSALTSEPSPPDAGRRCTVLVVFENRLVSLGGLGTVIRHFPRHLARGGEEVVLMTPLHRNHPNVKAALASGGLKPVHGGIDGTCGGFSFQGECYREKGAPVPTYHLGIEGYFESLEDPYHYEREERLLEDVLAFCLAVPLAVAQLGVTENVLFHAHDWETALVGLTSKMAQVEGRTTRSRTVATLHNSFDNGLPSPTARRFLGRTVPWETVLQCALPFLDGPLATVSVPFARELRHDPLQTTVFVPHLAEALRRNSPIGIENGPFGTPARAFAPAALRAGRRGDMRGLLREKRERERTLRRKLEEDDDSRCIGRLRFNSPGRKPLFVMSGRFDLAQKGFDLVFHAFQRLPRDSAYLLFSPSNPDSGSRDAFAFFADCTREREGEIAIMPFRIPGAFYRDVLRGSSFLLMPSFYEPFGAATEGAINGTPVIGRGTGGLWRQVHSWTPCPVPAFYGGLLRTQPGALDSATGILHREEFPEREAGPQWRQILGLGPRERIEVPLYRSMVDAAHRALLAAVDLYSRPRDYGRVVLNGVEGVSDVRNGWETAVEKYRRIYDVAGVR